MNKECGSEHKLIKGLLNVFCFFSLQIPLFFVCFFKGLQEAPGGFERASETASETFRFLPFLHAVVISGRLRDLPKVASETFRKWPPRRPRHRGQQVSALR